VGIIGEPIMDNQLLWYLSDNGQGMSDIGECLVTASRIEANDESSWFGGWLKTADRVRRVAENSLAAGHKGKASEPYLRAATYYRGALIHPQGLEHGASSRLESLTVLPICPWDGHLTTVP